MITYDQIFEVVNFIAFSVFTTGVLGILCLLLSSVYVWKRTHLKFVIQRGPAGYSIKAVNWALFGLSFVAFSFLPLTEGRALLRIAVALVLISEILYNWYYMACATKDAILWIRNHSPQPSQ